jgi:hypothetical protein
MEGRGYKNAFDGDCIDDLIGRAALRHGHHLWCSYRLGQQNGFRLVFNRASPSVFISFIRACNFWRRVDRRLCNAFKRS